MIARFLGAIQFLTLVPTPAGTASLGGAAVFFPIVGAVLGALAGGVCELTARAFGRSLGALLAIGFLVVVTGALHEDGLADVADAFRAGRSRERILAILKDSRIGTYGGLALTLSFAVRWQAVANGQLNLIAGMAAALGLSRASLVVLAATTAPLGEGLGVAYAQGISRPAVYVAVAQAVAIAVLLCSTRGVAMLLVSGLVILCMRAYFLGRAGGVNGDCLGATCQVVEAANLLVLAWQPSF